MSKFKGTAGPWRVEADTSVTSELNGFICQAYGDNTSWEEDEANAKLIAAAPELLEALRQLRDYVEDVLAVSTDDCDPQHPLIRATSVISKALGQ